MTIVSLKRVGIDEAFVAQEAADQETEFQHAFTLELLLSAGFALVLLASAPVVAAVYDDDRLLALTAATAYLPLAFALQSPAWVFFRRMDYARQRLLQAVVPVVAFAVTVPLAAAGVGVWSLVIGPAAGNLAGIVAALAASPYRLALRYDRAVARRYLRFSVPVFVSLVAALVVAQGQILAFDVDRGLEWVGFVTLAATLSRYIDRADTIVTSTIYPAICAIRDRTRALEELFVRSNRATLLWVLPACAGAVLFAGDLVAFVLGDEWRPARGLIQGLAVATAMGAARLQLVLVLPRARAHAAAGRRGRGGGGGLLRAGGPGARRRRRDAASSSGAAPRSPIQLGVRARYVRALLPAVRVRDLLARPAVPTAAAARGGARAARRAVGLRPAGGPGGRRARALRRRRRRADACASSAASSPSWSSAVRRAGPAQQQPGEGDRDEGDGGHLPVPVQAGVQGPGRARRRRGRRPGPGRRVGRGAPPARSPPASAASSARPTSPRSASVCELERVGVAHALVDRAPAQPLHGERPRPGAGDRMVGGDVAPPRASSSGDGCRRPTAARWSRRRRRRARGRRARRGRRRRRGAARARRPPRRRARRAGAAGARPLVAAGLQERRAGGDDRRAARGPPAPCAVAWPGCSARTAPKGAAAAPASAPAPSAIAAAAQLRAACGRRRRAPPGPRAGRRSRRARSSGRRPCPAARRRAAAAMRSARGRVTSPARRAHSTSPIAASAPVAFQ